MAERQAERAAELQDPEIRAELDRRARDGGETVVKIGGGGKTMESQERLAEGRKKGGISRADREGPVLIEPDEAQLQEAKKELARRERVRDRD